MPFKADKKGFENERQTTREHSKTFRNTHKWKIHMRSFLQWNTKAT